MARADWLEAGAAVLAGGGVAALTIDRLCVMTGRTKGSFYHHFRTMAAFEDALLGHWAEANRERVSAAADRPGETRHAMDELAVGLETGLEGAVRRWAAVHDGARRAVAAVDAQRVDFLSHLIARQHPSHPARDLALIEYAAFLGLLDLIPRTESTTLIRLTTLLRDLLTPAA